MTPFSSRRTWTFPRQEFIISLFNSCGPSLFPIETTGIECSDNLDCRAFLGTCNGTCSCGSNATFDKYDRLCVKGTCSPLGQPFRIRTSLENHSPCVHEHSFWTIGVKMWKRLPHASSRRHPPACSTKGNFRATRRFPCASRVFLMLTDLVVFGDAMWFPSRTTCLFSLINMLIIQFRAIIQLLMIISI